MAFTPRLTAPSRTASYYCCTEARQLEKYGRVVTYGGLNECILGNNSQDGSALPNCVGYAWGRWYEILGNRPKLSRADAKNWYGYTSDGYTRNRTLPSLGAVACFSSSGAGHIGVVERIESATEIVTSNSYYGSIGTPTDFILERLKFDGTNWRRYNYNSGREITGFTWQGFILLPTNQNVLSSIEVGGTNLEYIFEPNTFEYHVVSSENSTYVYATPSVSGQSVLIKVNNHDVQQGESVPLNDGDNAILVTAVLTVSGQPQYQIYAITVTVGSQGEIDNYASSIDIRGTDFDAIFNQFIEYYEYELYGGYFRVTVTPTDLTSTVTIYVNGTQIASGTGVTRGYADFDVGENTLNVNVTNSDSQGHSETRHYEVVISSGTDLTANDIRFSPNNDFEELIPYTPEFDPEYIEYNIQTKLRRIFAWIIKNDERAIISFFVNGNNIGTIGEDTYIADLRKGKNVIEIRLYGYKPDGTTFVHSSYYFNIYIPTKMKIIYALRKI